MSEPMTSSESTEGSEWRRATQEMRGRPVSYEEACTAAQRLINRAHNCVGEKSTMSIPVQASDDDVLLFDYLTEAHAKARQVDALVQALEKAREDMELFGDHTIQCIDANQQPDKNGEWPGCVCGFGAALAALQGGEVDGTRRL